MVRRGLDRPYHTQHGQCFVRIIAQALAEHGDGTYQIVGWNTSAMTG